MSMADVDEAIAALTGREEVQPWNDEILVRPIEEEEQTAGGLYVPTTARKPRLRRGVVVAVSPFTLPEEPTVPKLAPGDRVWFEAEQSHMKPGAPAEVEIEGVVHLLMSELYVRGVITRTGGKG